MKNSSLGASFALMKIFGRLTDSKSSFAPKNFHKYKTSTANTRICDSNSSATESSLREFAKHSGANSWQSSLSSLRDFARMRGIVAIQKK